jgi:hypothetical protein
MVRHWTGSRQGHANRRARTSLDGFRSNAVCKFKEGEGSFLRVRQPQPTGAVRKIESRLLHLNQWDALTRFLSDGDLEIDNGATERANRDIALGRANWTFFGSDNGGKTAAVLLSFVAMCKRNSVEPFAWFRDVLSRIATHPVNRLAELLPHNWQPLDATLRT